MKAVVFAYHDMGCAGIQSLLDAGYDIAAIFTHPDNPGENQFFGSVAAWFSAAEIPRSRAAELGTGQRRKRNRRDPAPDG